MKTPERGGLTSNVGFLHCGPLFSADKTNTCYGIQNLVYRYDVSKSDDGVGGEEGTFCLCTLWWVTSSFFFCACPSIVLGRIGVSKP